jgi:hypothetical protein
MNLLPPNPSIKVWIFQAKDKLSPTQKDFIGSHLNEFLPNWKAHQVKLEPGFVFVDDCGLVVFNDESLSGSSGCSIDKLIQSIKVIESQLNINLFNRMGIILFKGDEWILVEMDELINLFNTEAITGKDLILNQAAITADQLVVPLQNSWVNKYLKEKAY